ncbi:hypothetical protein BJ875DRAFT_485368 [Amylocarpus encephaloides]|uniref:Uncharacterized protein n=1 Tax=Amylocarpus encephaloides TaxID=45428 RepID=A0A9P7YHJ6_9HELO|nr:hypothetical protein BJ875DRAFT_485368 [Amylocarpus encephaloides]
MNPRDFVTPLPPGVLQQTPEQRQQQQQQLQQLPNQQTVQQASDQRQGQSQPRKPPAQYNQQPPTCHGTIWIFPNAITSSTFTKPPGFRRPRYGPKALNVPRLENIRLTPQQLQILQRHQRAQGLGQPSQSLFSAAGGALFDPKNPVPDPPSNYPQGMLVAGSALTTSPTQLPTSRVLSKPPRKQAVTGFSQFPSVGVQGQRQQVPRAPLNPPPPKQYMVGMSQYSLDIRPQQARPPPINAPRNPPIPTPIYSHTYPTPSRPLHHKPRLPRTPSSKPHLSLLTPQKPQAHPPLQTVLSLPTYQKFLIKHGLDEDSWPANAASSGGPSLQSHYVSHTFDATGFEVPIHRHDVWTLFSREKPPLCIDMEAVEKYIVMVCRWVNRMYRVGGKGLGVVLDEKGEDVNKHVEGDVGLPPNCVGMHESFWECVRENRFEDAVEKLNSAGIKMKTFYETRFIFVSFILKSPFRPILLVISPEYRTLDFLDPQMHTYEVDKMPEQVFDTFRLAFSILRHLLGRSMDSGEWRLRWHGAAQQNPGGDINHAFIAQMANALALGLKYELHSGFEIFVETPGDKMIQDKHRDAWANTPTSVTVRSWERGYENKRERAALEMLKGGFDKRGECSYKSGDAPYREGMLQMRITGAKMAVERVGFTWLKDVEELYKVVRGRLGEEEMEEDNWDFQMEEEKEEEGGYSWDGPDEIDEYNDDEEGRRKNWEGIVEQDLKEILGPLNQVSFAPVEERIDGEFRTMRFLGSELHLNLGPDQGDENIEDDN